MDVLRLLADERCVVCAARGMLLCRPCRRALPWLAGPLCHRCGEPAQQARIACPVCERLGRRLGGVRSALRLEGSGRALLHAWKDAARAPVGELAATCLLAVVARPAVDVIVAVPAAPGRAAWRGIDGPRDLARALGRRWSLPVRDDVLIRIAERPQRGLRAPERRRNAGASFAVAGRIAGRALLVDDVMTTGATLGACARQLQAAGAEQVHALTLARVVSGA